MATEEATEELIDEAVELGEAPCSFIDETDSGSGEGDGEGDGDGDDKRTIRDVLPSMPTMRVGRSSTKRENDAYELEHDIFTLLFTAPFSITSHAFCYFVFFFLFQVSVIVLILLDYLKDADENNALAIPPAVDTVVSVSQVFALFIAVITQNDVTTTLYLVSVGYDPEEAPPTASRAKWIISNILRFCLGMSLVFLCFVFIVQSTDVIELFKDFAAVFFVSEIDDVAFYLARRGFCTDELREATKQLENVRFPERDDTVSISTTGNCCNKKCGFRFRQVFLLAVFGGMVAAWAHLFYRQRSGDFVTKSISVRFGDEFFENLHYSYFSGVYVQYYNEIGHRPVYYERGFRETPLGAPGRFFYCEEIESWVFGIENITKGNKRDNGCHWLMRSPKTNAYDIVDVPFDGWKVWTGKIQLAHNFGFIPADCRDEADCNYHGYCGRNGECTCDEGWIGRFCNFENDVCEDVVFYIEAEPQHNYNIMLHADGTAVLAYERPVFSAHDPETGLWYIVLYSGRRWYITEWNITYTELLHIIDQPFFHAHWLQIYERNTLVFSEATDSIMPIGDLHWDILGASRPVGDYGPLGFWADFQFASMHCKDVDCSIPQVCGKFGDCQNSTCVCSNNHTGHFCQYPFYPVISEVVESIVANGGEL